MVKRLLLRHLLGLACLAAAGLVASAAVADHHLKQERGNRAEVAEWYCEHQGTRCGGVSSAGIEARWNQREVAYAVAVAVSVLGATGAGLLAAGSLRGRGDRAVRRPPV